jgi:hypothetical protein
MLSCSGLKKCMGIWLHYMQKIDSMPVLSKQNDLAFFYDGLMCSSLPDMPSKLCISLVFFSIGANDEPSRLHHTDQVSCSRYC